MAENMPAYLIVVKGGTVQDSICSAYHDHPKNITCPAWEDEYHEDFECALV